ncbi:hypothetical protein PtB15_4B622 [Puccinia triticina]|nr:hypothetical protein PtB15_4B622 [Puccinia triticina]
MVVNLCGAPSAPGSLSPIAPTSAAACCCCCRWYATGCSMSWTGTVESRSARRYVTISWLPSIFRCVGLLPISQRLLLASKPLSRLGPQSQPPRLSPFPP